MCSLPLHFLQRQSRRSRIVEFTSIFPDCPPFPSRCLCGVRPFLRPSLQLGVLSPLKRRRRNHSFTLSLGDFLLHYSLSSCNGARRAARCITRLHFLNRFLGKVKVPSLTPSPSVSSLPPFPSGLTRSHPESPTTPTATDRICVALTAVDSSFFSTRSSVRPTDDSASVVRSPLTF